MKNKSSELNNDFCDNYYNKAYLFFHNKRNEDALIGLGVLFELIWNSLNNDEKEKYLNVIMDKIKDLT